MQSANGSNTLLLRRPETEGGNSLWSIDILVNVIASSLIFKGSRSVSVNPKYHHQYIRQRG
mgnify:FL=1